MTSGSADESDADKMLGKSLISNESESLKSLLYEPRPGDFEIGSRARGVAARALLKAKSAGNENRFRVVLEGVGGPQVADVAGAKTLGATRHRRLCDDGLVLEIVDLLAVDVSSKEADRLVSRVPLDGKTYELAEL